MDFGSACAEKVDATVPCCGIEVGASVADAGLAIGDFFDKARETVLDDIFRNLVVFGVLERVQAQRSVQLIVQG